MDFRNVKSLRIPYLKNGETVIGEVKQIQDPNGNIIWKGTVSVSYIINTGVASITIVGNDGVTYVNGATASGSVDISPGVTITCSATVNSGYKTISDTVVVLSDAYTYSPTTYQVWTVTLSSTYGHWENSSGTTVTQVLEVPNNTAITYNTSSRTMTLTGIGTYTFIVDSSTAEYNYTFSNITMMPLRTKVDCDIDVSGSATRTKRSYQVTLYNNSSYQIRIGASSCDWIYINPGATRFYTNVLYGNPVTIESFYVPSLGISSGSKTIRIYGATTVNANVSYTPARWESDTYYSYTRSYNYSYLSSNTSNGGIRTDSGWTNYHAFRRSSSSTHVRMKFPYGDSGQWYGPVSIPSDLPNVDWYGDWIWYGGQEYADKIWKIYAANNRYIAFRIQSWEGDEESDSDQTCTTGLSSSSSTSSFDELYSYGTTVKMEVEWGRQIPESKSASWDV